MVAGAVAKQLREPLAVTARGDTFMWGTSIRRRLVRGLAWLVPLGIVPAGAAAPTALPLPDTGWYASAEALFLQLDHGANGNTPIVLDSLSGATLLGTNDLNYPMAAGPRLVLGRRLGEGRAAELVYFGLQDWDAGRLVRGDNDLRLPGDLGVGSLDFFNADSFAVTSGATINNVEANLWRPAGEGRLALMAGFRYLDLDERLSIRPTDSDTGASRYTIATGNDLFGGQLGGRYRILPDDSRRLGLEGVAKAGLFGNAAQMGQFVSDFDGSEVVRDTAVSAGRVAFVGELGVTGLIRVTQNLNARIGYSLLWVEGIARAANQLDYTDTAASGTTMFFGQGACLQGLNIGLELGW
jgi:hypothetical protein